jgi:4-hydroxy-tetrahydrodipicolinate reductase
MNIGILGCAGRMGQMIVREIAATDGARLAGGAEHGAHKDLGKDIAAIAGLGACGLLVSKDAESVIAGSDVVIDFTHASAAPHHATLCAQHKKALVIGTTGIDAAGSAEIERAAKAIPLVWASNYAVGVNVLFALTKRLAGVLGDDFDIEIVEMHHRHKVDAPSGTALTLGEMAAAGRGVNLTDVAARGAKRDGQTGARRKGDIGFAALRGGDVVGDHSVIFAGEGERIELTHKASSRVVFARGAVRAALWLKGKKPGRYSMADVLGFSE